MIIYNASLTRLKSRYILSKTRIGVNVLKASSVTGSAFLEDSLSMLYVWYHAEVPKTRRIWGVV